MIRSAPPVRYQETRPSADLAPFVHCFWELEGAGDALAEPIFPDGRIELVIHLAERPCLVGTSSPQPRVMVVGQMTAALRLQPVSHLHAIGVRFTPPGARAWLAAPVHEITNRILAVDDLRSAVSKRLLSAIDELQTTGGGVTAIEGALRATLREERWPHAVDRAVRTTMAHRGRVTIDSLARACQISARQLERQYLDTVGLTPKAFARTIRFQRALRALQAGTPAVHVAATAGFSDQAHLAREFRRFAGVAACHVDLGNVVFLQDGTTASRAD